MKTNKIYLVKNEEDSGCEFWEQYDSLVDAVSDGYKTEEYDEETDEVGEAYVVVYEAIPKRRGKYIKTTGARKLRE